MPAIRPSGDAADFTVRTVEFPKDYNALDFYFSVEPYTPPQGDRILVFFAQSARPAGDAVDFFTTAPSIRRIVATTLGVWRAPVSTSKLFSAPSAAGVFSPLTTDGSWGGGVSIDGDIKSGWDILQQQDSTAPAAWGTGGQASQETILVPWLGVLGIDQLSRGGWACFFALMGHQRRFSWPTSNPVDRQQDNRWPGYLMPATRPVDYLKPHGDAAEFSVYGGGVDCAQFGADSYSPPPGSDLVLTLSADPYSPPFMPAEPVRYVIAAGRRASFICDPIRVPAVTPAGVPVMDTSARDSSNNVRWSVAPPADACQVLPWAKYSRPLNPGWGIVVPGGPPTPSTGTSITIPIRRYYIMVNEMFLLRIEGNMMIPATDLSISFDRDSWCHQLSATVPYSYLDAVMPSPAPVKVAAFVNGTEFRILVERVGTTRAFGKKSVVISGRAVACEIDTPYVDAPYRTNSVAMTAQQLIDAALEYSTYSQDWRIDDWLVPAGALSITGSPISVAGHVAEAAGAVLAADWSQNVLRMMPRYPVKPWDWDSATPDYIIPAAVAETENIEWTETPAFNAVFITGVDQGIVARVKRTGTAGDQVAPMIAHPLISHPVAAEQMGISVLSAGGRKATMQLTMPVLDEIGIIEHCRLIEFSDSGKTRRGVTCANNITGVWPTLRQTITVETLA